MLTNIIYLIPLVSIINLFYLFYKLKNKDISKSEKKNIITNNVLTIVYIIIISLLSVFIEYNMGKIFQILVIVISIILTSGESEFINKIFYFLGVASIISIYIYRNKYIRSLMLLIILSVIITLEIIKSKNKDINKNIILINYLRYYLEGLLLTSLILSWSEYGKEPQIKYIKLFLRRK